MTGTLVVAAMAFLVVVGEGTLALRGDTGAAVEAMMMNSTMGSEATAAAARVDMEEEEGLEEAGVVEEEEEEEDGVETHNPCSLEAEVITDEAEEEGEEEEVAEEVTWEEVETLYLIRAIQFT